MKKFTFAAIAVPLMWLLLLLLFFNSSKLHAQETTVLSGVVKSADGTPMEGVTVWQKDTDNGTQTSETGYYTLQVSNSLPVTFEYLGYKTQTVKPAGPVLNVTLQTDDNLLDEVVINAGYYSVKDKERTGSISKITAKEIGQQPVANPLAAMQGRMAGVNITQSSGTPGGGFDIQIRGRNSLRTEGNAPLYIVDGVPYPSQSESDYTLSGGILPVSAGSPLNSINPASIESIEVLKDADATAIYGSRGSNGVVLITTKKSHLNKISYSVQSTTSVSAVAKKLNLMNTAQYLQLRRDAFANDGITTYPANAYDVNGKWKQNKYTNWQDQLIGKTAVAQNTQFSMSGGSSQTSYMLSAAHRQDGAVFNNDTSYKITNFLLNVRHTSNDQRFNLNTTVQKVHQSNNTMAADLTKDIYLTPNAPDLFLLNGDLNWEDNTFENPLAKTNNRFLSNANEFMAQINVSYKFSNNIELALRSGTTDLKLNEIKTAPSTTFNPSLGYDSTRSSMQNTDSNRSSWIVEPQLNYDYKKSSHKINFLIGGTFEEKNSNALALTASNFTSNDLIYNIANAVTQKVTKDTEAKYRYMALFSRFNYSYDNKYLVNLTLRRDGSSRFGANNRFANFGAIGTAWIFSREKFLENVSWMNLAKVRTSFGTAGSDLIGDYQYLNTFGITAIPYDNIVSLQPLRLYNPDFSWEKTTKFETALEFELFNSRLATTLSYYKNRSSNQLVGIPLPGTTGFNTVHGNLAATVENNGFEFFLRTTNITKSNFKWFSSFNITLPKNKLIDFPNLSESTYSMQYEIGKPITIKKVYTYKGVNPETGLYEFEDKNNDGVITIADRTKTVDSGTKYYGGLSNTIQYGNWTIDMLLQFVSQNKNNALYYASYPGSQSNIPSSITDYWTPNNPDALYQRPTTGANRDALMRNQLYKDSDAVIEDASFIRFKTLNIQYQIPWQKYSNVKVAFFVQGHNLLTITKYSGIDPETPSTFLPALRTWALGLNINF